MAIELRRSRCWCYCGLLPSCGDFHTTNVSIGLITCEYATVRRGLKTSAGQKIFLITPRVSVPSLCRQPNARSASVEAAHYNSSYQATGTLPTEVYTSVSRAYTSPHKTHYCAEN